MGWQRKTRLLADLTRTEGQLAVLEASDGMDAPCRALDFAISPGAPAFAARTRLTPELLAQLRLRQASIVLRGDVGLLPLKKL